MIKINNIKIPKDIEIGDKITFQKEQYFCRDIILQDNKIYAQMVHCLFPELILFVYICEEEEYDF